MSYAPRNPTLAAYPAWKAPREQGARLVWPAPDEVTAAAGSHAARPAADHLTLLGVSGGAWRQEMRRFVGHDEARPLIVTGHQGELHHPGVWFKDVVIDAAARAAGGVALHVAVDTDAPKHLRLKWPGFAAGLTDDPRLHGAAWTGLLHPPTPAHLDLLLDAADAARRAGVVSPMTTDFLARCRAYLVDQRDAVAPLDLPGMLADAQHTLDWDLGLRYTLVTLSPLLWARPWAAFVAHVSADAEAFARAYNRALGEYRVAAGLRGRDRPMPDLELAAEGVELPFWLDDVSAGTRRRARVRVAAGGATLAAGGETFTFTGDEADADGLTRFLRRVDYRLVPRALSLTMFLRLFVADVFVHGIGGGVYDQVTDRLLLDYFGVGPPAFSVATATLFHPSSVGRGRVCMACVKSRMHKAAHDVLRDRKAAWLSDVAAAGSARERRRAFGAMHDARRVALRTDPVWSKLLVRRDEARRGLAEEAEIFDRELFYGVQPRATLDDVIRATRRDFTAAGPPPAA